MAALILQGSKLMRISDFFFVTDDLTTQKVMRRQVQRYSDKIFLTYLPDGRTFTYLEIDTLSNKLANNLLTLGVIKGTHVGLMMDNSPEHVILTFALAKLGAVSVPINTACRGQLLRYYLEQSDSEWIAADNIYLNRIDEVLDCDYSIRGRLVFGPMPLDFKSFDLNELITTGSSEAPPVEVHCSDTACLAYTSGTTGPSKGNILSQAASLSFGLSNAEHHGYTEDDVIYICLPLFHVNAMQSATHSALVCGGSIVMSKRFSTSHFWTDLRDNKVTITNLLGSMVNFLWTQPPSPSDRDHCLRMVSVVPTPLFAKEFAERFDLAVTSSFGMSDFGMCTVFSYKDPQEKLGSAGRPRTFYELQIVDDNDFKTPVGVVGEITFRCNEPWRAPSGYYKMPEETLASHRNQWFHTGDRGYIDADGYLFFVDRKKDAIRRRGENISAFEVENIICLHPAVAEAAVYPVNADTSEEEVGVSVRLREGVGATESDIVQFCMANMAYYMVPRYINFRNEFPRTLNQKIQKHKLKQEIEATLSEIWDRDRAGIVVRR